MKPTPPKTPGSPERQTRVESGEAMDAREMIDGAYEEVERERLLQFAAKHGLEEAIRLCEQYRDMNSPGTASFALHNSSVQRLMAMRAVL